MNTQAAVPSSRWERSPDSADAPRLVAARASVPRGNFLAGCTVMQKERTPMGARSSAVSAILRTETAAAEGLR